MEPSVMDINEQDNMLKFTISNTNVSFANALRRTIISDIPTVVIRTFPYEKNDAIFEINTTRFNNEILKQRLSCIPIYIKDLGINLEDYLLEIDVKNTYDQMMYITTADFKIKNLKTDKYLSDSNLSEIFPPNPISNQFIDFCRLKPAYSEDYQGEHIKLTAKFTISTAKENGSFNVVSTCAYANTPDIYAIDQAKQTKLEELQTKYTSDEDIKYHLTDWLNLDAKRIYIPDSFDFKIKTLGVFTNNEIVIKAIKIIIEKLFGNASEINRVTSVSYIFDKSFTLLSISILDFETKPNFDLSIGFPKPSPPFAVCFFAIANAIPRTTSLSLAIPLTFIQFINP